MSTLTLSLDDDLVAQAEAYAQRTGVDVSTLVANALRPIVKQERPQRPLSPEVEELLGCVTPPDGFNYKEYLADAITDR